MKVDKNTCIGCGTCAAVCPVDAIYFENGKAKINQEKCVKCGTCAAACPVRAISRD